MTRRFLHLPLAVHAGLLLAVLVALGAGIGTRGSFVSDEGASILQARSLARGDGWVVPLPLPKVDPDGRWFPLEPYEIGPKGRAPFGKHPFYAMAMAGAYRLGGVSGVIGLSVLAGVAAALSASGLAGVFDRRLAVPALWVTGLASPLLFDSFLAVGHTIGAAGAGLAVLAAVSARARPTWRVVGVIVGVGAAVVVRSEALLLAAALAVVLVLAAWRARKPLLAVIGVAAATSAVGARAAETLMIRHALGRADASVGVPARGNGRSFVGGRWEGFVTTWLQPTARDLKVAALCVVAVAVAAAIAAVMARRRPSDVGALRLLVAIGVGAAAVRVVAAPLDPVPGLIMAFPIGWVGILLLRRADLAGLPRRIAAATAALFAVGVLLTQYPEGGSAEWGGRYFALMVPLVVPLALVSLIRQGASLSRAARGVGAVGLAAVSILFSFLAVGSLRAVHDDYAKLVGGVERVAASTVSTGQRPVIVTTESFLPRMSWRTYAHQRWLLVLPPELPVAGRRLRDAGIAEITLVDREDASQVIRFDGYHVTRHEVIERQGTWHVTVLTADGQSP
ncbi:MAG: hypothetical protein JWO37_1538 [Acidimicrobiales bacterium]|nr:hypothetical protein [Acidimicrobiales bacterium]